ncbi:MAG: AAA family ATPase [Duodenibacillus massiliensis]
MIDEYDVPLAKSSHKDHYDQMLEFIRQLLGKVLKPQPNLKFDAAPYLKKSVLTGCLRVSKESIFTGVNNFDVNTVCSQDQELSDVIGFTPKEVETLLNYYGMESRFEDVRYWYDGYRFYRSEIYCPWDVINFASKALASGDIAGYAPENFWTKRAVMKSLMNSSVLSQVMMPIGCRILSTASQSI